MNEILTVLENPKAVITLAGYIAFKMRHLAYLIRMPGFFLTLKSAGSRLFSKK